MAEFLGTYGIWIFLGLMLLFMLRGRGRGHGMGCGMGSHQHDSAHEAGTEAKDVEGQSTTGPHGGGCH